MRGSVKPKKDTRTQWFNLETDPPAVYGTYELKGYLGDVIKARISGHTLGSEFNGTVVTEEQVERYKPGDHLPGPEGQPYIFEWRGLARKPHGMART